MSRPDLFDDYARQLAELSESVLSEIVAAADDPVDSYRINFSIGHCQALANSFPATRRLLAGRPFAALAQVYVKHYPCDHWDINRYGSEFSELLAAQCRGPKAEAYDWPQLAALARLEYAIGRVYYSDADEANAVEALPGFDDGLETASCDCLLHAHRYLRPVAELDWCQPLTLHWQSLNIIISNAPSPAAAGPQYV